MGVKLPWYLTFFHKFFINCFSFAFWPCATACQIFVPQSGIKPLPLHWKHRMLTTGSPGKSLVMIFRFNCVHYSQHAKIVSFESTSVLMKNLGVSLKTMSDKSSSKLWCCTVLSHSVMSNSLWPHGLWPTRLLCLWGFSRQEYWSGLPCPPPGDLPNSGFRPRSPALQADSSPTEPPGKASKLW